MRAARDGAKAFLVHQDFGGSRTRIIVRGLREAVSASAPKRQQIAGLRQNNRPIVEESVACFAHRADDLCTHDFTRPADDWSNWVNGAVQSRADEIVHGRVNDDKSYIAVLFEVQNAGEKHPRGTYDGAARFEQEVAFQWPNVPKDEVRIGVNPERRFGCVANANATAQIHEG